MKQPEETMIKKVEEEDEVEDEQTVVKTKTKKSSKHTFKNDKIVKKNKEEEDQIEVIGKKVKSRVDTKTKSMKEKEEEIEVVVEEETRKEKMKKRLKANKPIEDEEIMTEETTEILDITPTQHLKGIPLKTPRQMSETVPEAVVSMIGDVPTTGVTGNLSILTFSAIEKQEIQEAEKEDDRPASLLPASFKAKAEIDTIEPFFITEPQVENIAGEFSDTFRPTTREATRTIMTKEGLVISETLADQRVEDTKETKTEESHATVSLLLHEAKSISETETSLKEGEFEQIKKPLQFTAAPGLNLQEGLSVTEVTQSIKEEKLEDFTIQSKVKPKVGFEETEPLIISEVLAETKPGKYFPELFVPTEIATPSIVSQRNTAFTEEMQLPEKEGEFIPGRLPQGQFAGLQILQEDSVVVSETNIHEKEIIFGPGQKPNESVASQEVSVLEGIVVSFVQHQDNENLLEVCKPDMKTVDVLFTNKESLFIQETNIAESEEKLQIHEVPGAKSALPSFSCLEIPEVSETVISEVTDDYKPEKHLLGTTAAISFQPIEPISVIEVKAEDTPASFSEVLKYRTDAALPTFETLESKEIMEVTTQDSEKPLSTFEIPTAVSGNKTYESKEGISIFQADTIEKEGDYTPYQSPETHTGKAVPTHSLHSVIIEEITPEGSVGNISKTYPQSIRAKLEHTTLQETVVEEAVIDESLTKHPEEKIPEGKRADINVMEEQSLTVTEIITDYKEDQYKKPNLPEECFASQSHLPQKVATKTEILPEQTASPLLHKLPATSVAKPKQVSFEGLVISSVEVAESESEFKKETSPTKSKANVEFSEQFSGVTVQEIVSNEKEFEHIPKEKPTESKAIQSITPHHTALQSQTLSEVNLGNIPKIDHPTGLAKVERIPLQEVIVTETNISEVETTLNTMKPELKTATVGIRSGESFLVSEVVAEDKEELFKSTQIPEGRRATLNLSSQEVAEQEEVVELIQEGTWTRLSPDKDQAIMKQDTIQLAVASQQVASELEGKFEAPIKPEEKVAALSFVEGNVLSVTEMNAVDKEVPLETATAPKTAIAIPDISGQDIAVISEVVVDINVGNVDVLKLEFSEAKVKQTTHESVILRETTVAESEGEYISDALPDMKKAKPNIVEGHSTSISSIVMPQDKERILTTLDKPKERLATPNITSQEIAEKTEIVLGSSLDSLKHITPITAQATAKQLPHHSIIQTETSFNELEGLINFPIKPESKIAEVAFEDIEAVTVLEISTQDETGHLAPDSKPEDQFAITDILPRQVAQNIVVIPDNTTGEVEINTPSKAQASLEQIPYEIITTSFVSTAEKESVSDYQMKFDLKTADKAIEEEKSLLISEVIVEDKEEEFKPFSKPKEATAFADIRAQEVAEMSETITQYSVGEVPAFNKPTTVTAFEEQLPYESIIQTETSVQESEGIFKTKAKPSSSVAEIGVVEEKGVVITEVISEDKEDKYSSDYLPETKQAESTFIPIELYQKSEVVTHDSVSEISLQTPEKTFAKILQTPLHSVSLKQTTIGESEQPLENFIKPFSKTADTTYESAKTGINVNEVTVQEKEGELEGLMKPVESTADKILSAREIASKSEVLVESTVEQFESQRPVTEKASVDQLPLQSVILSEISVAEKEGEYKGLIKPAIKNAEISFEEGQGVSVVEVVAGDIEKTFLPGEIPSTKSASISVTGREVAIKTEVNIDSTVEDMPKKEHHQMKNVSIQQLPFESVITTKPIVNEKEVNLEEFVKSETQTANIVFEEGKSINVSHVIVEDKESELEVPEKPKKRIAIPDVSTHVIAEQSFVQTEFSIGEISTLDKKLVQAVPEQMPLEGIVMTVPGVIEKEETFDKEFKPKTMTAQSVIDEKQSVNITLTTSGDKEVHFDGHEKPKERKAAPTISELEVAEQLEHTLQHSVSDLEQLKPTLMMAHPHHTTFESLLQTETVIRESEGKLESTAKPDQRKASMSYEVEESINICEVTLGEAESAYLDKFKPKDSKAKIVLSDTQEIAKQTQITPEDSLTPLKHDVVVEEKAVAEQTSLVGVIVSENFPQEKETEFVGQFKPITKKADFNIEKGRKVQAITEIIPEQKEGILAPLEMPEDKIAIPDLVTREIAQVSETLTQMNVEEIISKSTKTTTAIRTQTPYEISVHEQVIVQESEEDFIQTSPKIRKASLTFEEGKGVVITEVTPADNEVPYNINAPISQVAHPEVIIKEAAETIEVSAEIQPSHMTIEFPEEATAIIDQSQLTSLLQTEVKVEETEIELKIGEVEKKVADFSFEEEKGIGVTIVTVEDKEEDLKPTEKPLMKKAIPAIISQDSLQASEVQTEQTVSEIKQKKPKEAKATAEQPINESIIVTQNIPEEQEKILSCKPTTPSAKAQVEISKTRKVAEKSEVILGIHPETLEPIRPAESHALPDAVLLEGLIQSEVHITEVEDQLVEPEKPTKRRASIIKDTNECINIMQTVVADKEGIHEIQPLPKQVKPSASILEQETIVQTEVLISSSTANLEKDKKPDSLKIHPKQIPFESIETSETTVHEHEEHMSSSWKPTVSKGEKSVEEIQSITVMEVVTSEQELEHVKEGKTPREVAEKSVVEQEIAIKSEVIAQLPVTPLDLSTPTPSIAKQSTPIQHHLTVTSHDTGEVEDSLPGLIIPQAQKTAVVVEEHKPTLIVSQVHPQEIPGKFLTLMLVLVDHINCMFMIL